MGTPTFRTKIITARGTFAALDASKGDLADGELCFATDLLEFYVKYGNNLVNVVSNTGGAVDSVNGQVGVVELTHTDVGAASAAQGLLANTAIQPGTINPVYFPAQSNFPSAAANAGGIAHSAADGAMFFAYNSTWIKLANASSVPSSGSFVQKTGDNMTGPLTFDTDKIVFTIEGNGDFDGTVTGSAFYGDGSNLTGVITPGTVNPVYFADQAAFPDATANHGAIAHSHADGAMFFAHGGVWNRLANYDDAGGVNNLDIAALPPLP